MPQYLVGVDLGGTNIKAGVLTTEGEVIAQDRTKTESEGGPKAVVERMGNLVRTVLPRNTSFEGVGQDIGQARRGGGQPGRRPRSR